MFDTSEGDEAEVIVRDAQVLAGAIRGLDKPAKKELAKRGVLLR